MAITKMNRFSLFTFERNKQELLKALQAFEQAHFRRLDKEDFEGYEAVKRNVENAVVYENELARVKYAADRLKPFAEMPKGLKALTTPPTEMTFDELNRFTSEYDYAEVCESVRTHDERLKAVQAEIARIKAENDNLRAWSGFDAAPSDLDGLKHVRYMIGSVNKNAAGTFVPQIESAFPAAYVETLHTVKDDTVILVMSAADEWDALSAELKNAGFTRVSLGFTGIPSDKIRENDKRLAELTAETVSEQESLKSCAPQYAKLLISADYFRTALERARACENFANYADVLIIEGWTPQEKSGSLHSILDKVCGEDYYLEESPVEHDAGDVPIVLKNNKFVSAFEDLTVMFALPRYNEIDPTPLIAPFYMLFFGLMVGDMGYGLLLLLATALLLKFTHMKKGMRNFIKFFFFLSFGVIFAGLLYGSFFGNTVFTPLKTADGDPKAILDSNYDILMMLILSVAIGVIQVLFGLCVKAYMLIRDGKVLDAIFDSLFWLITLLSGILLLSAALPACSPLRSSRSLHGDYLAV